MRHQPAFVSRLSAINREIRQILTIEYNVTDRLTFVVWCDAHDGDLSPRQVTPLNLR
jgi:hypothetical protein